MPCDPSCARPSPAQAHCSVCHRTFGGISGFTRHRRHGVCLDPTELGLTEIKGIWRLPMTPEYAARLTLLAADLREGRPPTGTTPEPS